MNGSPATAAWSSTPSSRRTVSRSRGDGVGTTRSTIVHGKRTCAPIHSPSALPRAVRHPRAEVVHEPLEDPPVAREVVARDHRDRRPPHRRPSAPEPAGELAERGGGRAAAVRSARTHASSASAPARVARVAALGDGERDDVDGGIRDPRRRLRAGHDVAQEREHLGGVAVGPALRDGVEPVLGRERVDRRAAARRDAADAPRRWRVDLERPHGVQGLVGARERADAQVDDAHRRPLVQRGPAAEPVGAAAAGASRGTVVLPPPSIAGTLPGAA